MNIKSILLSTFNWLAMTDPAQERLQWYTDQIGHMKSEFLYMLSARASAVEVHSLVKRMNRLQRRRDRECGVKLAANDAYLWRS